MATAVPGPGSRSCTRLPLNVVLACCAALVSYHVIERPFLRARRFARSGTEAHPQDRGRGDLDKVNFRAQVAPDPIASVRLRHRCARHERGGAGGECEPEALAVGGIHHEQVDRLPLGELAEMDRRGDRGVTQALGI